MVGAFGILILFGFIWIVFHYISKLHLSVSDKIKIEKNKTDIRFHNKSFEIRDESNPPDKSTPNGTSLIN